MNTPDRTATLEANRLYWETDMSVADIAERMGWSRRALYDAVEPLPSDVPCETCGTPLVFANRSARSSGTVTCYACAANEPATATRAGASIEEMTAAEGRDRREHGYAVGGAAAAGLALGAALTLLLIPRR